MKRSGAIILSVYVLIYIILCITFPHIMFMVTLGSSICVLGLVCSLSFDLDHKGPDNAK